MKPWLPEQVIPHSGNVVLVERIDQLEDERVLCSMRVPAQGPFNHADGSLPAYIGLEIMAQAVAVWAGAWARDRDEAPGLGFLLGTRHYHCNVQGFAAGALLQVEAHRRFHDDQGMAAFDCRIHGEGIEAKARLSVYRPRDADAFIDNAAGAAAHD